MKDKNGEEIDINYEYEYARDTRSSQRAWLGVTGKIVTLDGAEGIIKCNLTFIPDSFSISTAYKIGTSVSFYARDVIKAMGVEERLKEQQKITEEIKANKNRNVFDCNFRV